MMIYETTDEPTSAAWEAAKAATRARLEGGNAAIGQRSPTTAIARGSSRKPTLHETILETWNSDPALRAEFGSLPSFAAWKEREHARKTGIPMAALREEKADVQAYLNGLSKPRGSITNQERSEADGWAAEWQGSEDIRREFGSFAIYCHYMKAKASGRARIIGG